MGRQRRVADGGVGRHEGGEAPVRRQTGAVEAVEKELGDDGQNEAQQDGDDGPEWVTPVHQVVGVRAAARPAAVVDEVNNVEDAVDEAYG